MDRGDITENIANVICILFANHVAVYACALAVSDTGVKLLYTSGTHYLRNCYLMLKGQDEIGRTNWATSLKHLHACMALALS